MATYVILSRFSPAAFADPKDFKKLAASVSAEIKSQCPGVRWKAPPAEVDSSSRLSSPARPSPRQILDPGRDAISHGG